MKAIWLCLLLAACGGGSDFGSCPKTTADWNWDCRENVEPGTSCVRPESTDAGTALPENCYCNGSGFWECDSCPFFWEPVAPVPCEQGQTCVLNNWEHGCSCACGSDGTWKCSPDTVGSHCPGGVDAGV